MVVEFTEYGMKLSVEKVFFLHIEKTAGTSFRHNIQKQFRPSDICPAYHQPELLALPHPQIEAYRLFCGHYRFEVQAYVTKTMPRVIVMLREPAERTLSHLQHIQRDSVHNELLRTQVPINELSLEELAEHPFILNYLREFQTKKLGLAFDPSDASLPLTLYDSSIRYDDSLLNRALDNLSRCFFVGITEQFSRSIRTLFNRMGWAHDQAKTLHLNKAPTARSFTLPDRMLNALEMDYVLYERAKRLFSYYTSSWKA